MIAASLEGSILSGRLIALDTSVILAYLVGSEAASPAATAIVDGFVRPGRNPAVVSAMTVTESLVRAFETSADDAVLSIETFLRWFPHLSIVPTDFQVASEAARIRAATRLPTPDAIIVASAVVSGAEYLGANDDGWSAALRSLGDPIRLCHLKDYISPE
ncbi:MAG: PIN domain-containing protein [Chloroflexi bacterium]|nr:PIN domain-containing protein [Chloroflexota bacterium]